jgi:hypothetical protein
MLSALMGDIIAQHWPAKAIRYGHPPVTDEGILADSLDLLDPTTWMEQPAKIGGSTGRRRVRARRTLRRTARGSTSSRRRRNTGARR